MGNEVPWSLLRKLLKNADDDGSIGKISKDSLKEFEDIVLKYSQEIAKKAVILMKHDNRRTIFPKDITTAVTMLK